MCCIAYFTFVYISVVSTGKNVLNLKVNGYIFTDIYRNKYEAVLNF